MRLRPCCRDRADRKSTRLNSSHLGISYAVFCLKKKKHNDTHTPSTTSAGHLSIAHLYPRAGVRGGPRAVANSEPHASHSSLVCPFFFFNDTATTEIYTLSLHDALPISCRTCPEGDHSMMG